MIQPPVVTSSQQNDHGQRQIIPAIPRNHGLRTNAELNFSFACCNFSENISTEARKISGGYQRLPMSAKLIQQIAGDFRDIETRFFDIFNDKLQIPTEACATRTLEHLYRVQATYNKETQKIRDEIHRLNAVMDNIDEDFRNFIESQEPFLKGLTTAAGPEDSEATRNNKDIPLAKRQRANDWRGDLMN
jgi:hypothetical protein